MRPVTEDLAAFLNARLDEEETAAQARVDAAKRRGFITDHSAARDLREVEAERALITFALENAASVDGEWGDGHDAGEIAGGQCEDRGMRAANRVLGLLAAIDSDHPDYRQEWKP